MEDSQQQNYSFDWVVLSTIMNIIKSKANNEKDKYTSYVESGLRLLMVYYPDRLKIAIQEDMESLRNEIQKLKATEKNEVTKEKKIMELKMDFAETHEAYVFTALTKVGIIKIQEEGVIDFEKHDINQIARAVRAGGAKLDALKESGILEKKE